MEEDGEVALPGRPYDRLLLGGIWAQVEVRHKYDETASGKKSPFRIQELEPIQLATFSFDEYRRGRGRFTTDGWLDFLLRSIGLDPELFERRLKLLYLSRFIPMCERNYNFVELGGGLSEDGTDRMEQPYSRSYPPASTE